MPGQPWMPRKRFQFSIGSCGEPGMSGPPPVARTSGRFGRDLCLLPGAGVAR